MSRERTLRVGLVGGLGRMASPLAYHWSKGGPVRVIRVHDRGKFDDERNRRRQAWRAHGADLVNTFEELIGPGDIDGIFVCCGKNGDDLPIISHLCHLLTQYAATGKFICHLSTVSTGFVSAANDFCSAKGVRYANYPLTGAVSGAEKGALLIFASGNADLHQQLHAGLQCFGRIRYFGQDPTAGVRVKLTHHLMVFSGLLGICAAAAAYSESFLGGAIGGETQAEFFDFINAGAGGTRMWDLVLSKGIRDGVWNAPFPVDYGAADAIYAADFSLARKVSSIAAQMMITAALTFSYVLNYADASLAIHSITREFLAKNAKSLDEFLHRNAGDLSEPRDCLRRCISSLPASVQDRVRLSVAASDFESAS